MLFEQYDGSSRKTKRTALAAGLAAAFLLTIAALAPRGAPDVAGDSQAAAVARLERLCGALPRPEKFQLARRELPLRDGRQTTIVYRYRSPRALEEVLPVFTAWFAEHGWQPVAGLDATFAKGRQSVLITTDDRGPRAPNFKIYCSETDAPLF